MAASTGCPTTATWATSPLVNHTHLTIADVIDIREWPSCIEYYYYYYDDGYSF